MSLVGSVVYAGSHPRVRIRLPELRRFEAETGEKFEREDDEVALIVNVVDRRYASASDGSAWETKRGRFREARGRLGLSHAARGKLDDYATRIWKDHETARESPHALLPNPSDEECDGSHAGPACGYDCPLFCGGRGGGGAECGCGLCAQFVPGDFVATRDRLWSDEEPIRFVLRVERVFRDAAAARAALPDWVIEDTGGPIVDAYFPCNTRQVFSASELVPATKREIAEWKREQRECAANRKARSANPTYVARDPFARGEYRRESAGPGSCSWCGQQRRVLYTYEWESDSGNIGRRSGGPARGKFCGLPCFRSYHDVRANPGRPMCEDCGKTDATHFDLTIDPNSTFAIGPAGSFESAMADKVMPKRRWCAKCAWHRSEHHGQDIGTWVWSREENRRGQPWDVWEVSARYGTAKGLHRGSRCVECEDRRIVRPNPHLILVTGNPAPGAVEKAWCKFHQRDSYDGRTVAFGTIKGMPSFVFALGKCKSVELDGVERTFKPQPWLVCAPDDDSLWIVTKDVMNLGSDAAGRKLTAITYDPTRESGKEPAYYRHEFDTPRPVMTPVGNPHKCRAVLLDGGAYTVSDWVHG